MVGEIVVEFMQRIYEKLQVQKKTEEMRNVFKKEFGFEPQVALPNKAQSEIIVDGTIFDEVTRYMMLQLCDELYNFAHKPLAGDDETYKLIFEVERVDNENEKDWELDDTGDITKISNGFRYTIHLSYHYY